MAMLLFVLAGSTALPQELLQVDFPHADRVRRGGCLPGFWGPACESDCHSDSCRSEGMTCDQVTGSVLSCEGCIPGRWGESCERECTLTDHCDYGKSITCDKQDGGDLRCAACQLGWTGTGCETEIKCPSLDIVDAFVHSECMTSRPYTFNASCAFRCSVGYELVGKPKITCLEGSGGSGRWSAAIPTCKAKSCTPVDVPLGLPCSEDVKTGDYCYPTPNESGVVCVGSWHCEGQEGLDSSRLVPVNSIIPQCFAATGCDACDSHARCKLIDGKSVCVCDSGYWGTGASCSRCTRCGAGYQNVLPCGLAGTSLSSSDLSSHDAVCKDIDECTKKCNSPDDLNCHNCQHNCHNQPGFYTCSCVEGFRLGPDGFSCIASECGAKEIHNSHKVCRGPVGSTCKFGGVERACLPGYMGSGKLVCTETGVWVGDASCDPLTCDIIPIAHIDQYNPCKEHARPWTATFRAPVKDKCTLNCNKGYHVSGSGVMTCSPCGSSIASWSTDSRCEANICRPFLVDVHLRVECSGISTNEKCIAGEHFTCPAGYVAKGLAICTSDGILRKDDVDPARCEKDEGDANTCSANPCEGGLCIPNSSRNSSVPYTCRCNFPYVQNSDQSKCVLGCPPPAMFNVDLNECTYPVGFKRVLFSTDVSPSAIMIGQKEIPKGYKSSETRCEKISYTGHYVWDFDRQPLHLIVSVQHPSGRVHGNEYTEKEKIVDIAANPPIVYWVENITVGYFTFCYTELNPKQTDPHEKIVVNFLAFTHLFGAAYGESVFNHKTYTLAKPSLQNVDKFVGVSGFSLPPLVLTTLVHNSEDPFCDDVHCVCSQSHHNAAGVMAQNVYTDTVGMSYFELPKHRKRTSDEVAMQISTTLCDTRSCSGCPRPNGNDKPIQLLCEERVRDALHNHGAATCNIAKDAQVSWLAFPPRKTATLATGTHSLKFERMNLNKYLTSALCHFIPFDELLVDPVIFASVNRRSGDNFGVLPTKTEPVVTWHIEGVDTSGFRFCYFPLLESFDQQPSTQEEYLKVDWLAFHA